MMMPGVAERTKLRGEHHLARRLPARPSGRSSMRTSVLVGQGRLVRAASDSPRDREPDARRGRRRRAPERQPRRRPVGLPPAPLRRCQPLRESGHPPARSLRARAPAGDAGHASPGGRGLRGASRRSRGGAARAGGADPALTFLTCCRRARRVFSQAAGRAPARTRGYDPRSVQTVYEAAGGYQGLLCLARAWHSRVMADELVSHAFSHGFHPDHSKRLAAYWAEALGGPTTFSAAYGDETSVVRMHSGNGVHEEMDRRAIACFDEALKDVGFAGDDRLRQVLHEYFSWATTTTMSRYHRSADDVPDGLEIPHWSWDGLVGARES